MEIRTVIGLAVAGALALGVGWHLYQDHETTVELATTKTRLAQALESTATLKSVNDDLSGIVDKQNGQIDVLKKASDARQAAAKIMTTKAAAGAQVKYAAAQTLLKRPMSVPDDACKSADALLTETIKARQ